jgi:arylsulfatase A-like enzyme
VPCIVWAPGRIPAGTECDALASTIDLLPTIAAITGTPLSADRAIDGVDISALLRAARAAFERDKFTRYPIPDDLKNLNEATSA